MAHLIQYRHSSCASQRLLRTHHSAPLHVAETPAFGPAGCNHLYSDFQFHWPTPQACCSPWPSSHRAHDDCTEHSHLVVHWSMLHWPCCLLHWTYSEYLSGTTSCAPRPGLSAPCRPALGVVDRPPCRMGVSLQRCPPQCLCQWCARPHTSRKPRPVERHIGLHSETLWT